eukprot:TRINITY_DN2469_c0_g2_i1.p2 TRINITY_DN2469_c0_g2~~TRINITY_DN2469_c0_g2_i1.p2  ORF type:complete len:520 (+),score=166.98 TRINITY_DN2469_c0_g2_i1:43-1602(+)
MAVRSHALLLCALAGAAGGLNIDTSQWLGSAYTPAASPNALWWSDYDSYEASVQRDLPLMAKWGVNTVRLFLHTMSYQRNATQLHDVMDRFLTTAAEHKIRAGFVFFDDVWNHEGASLDVVCVPKKGKHNGCWFTSPQDVERTSIERFRPYVETTVARFAQDPRVLWWEVYNEPLMSDPFSRKLREASYHWAKGQMPTQPVLSCWDDHPSTDIIDHHNYETLFSRTWLVSMYANPTKTAFVTEGGSRWYQPPYSKDAASPLTILHFLEALRNDTALYPFVPGMMLCWTMFVGNDNTRWHWDTVTGSPEPVVPWDGLLLPDGTPVSYTEMGAFRRYATGRDDFLTFNDFLLPGVVDNDTLLALDPAQDWHAPAKAGDGTGSVTEASVWPARRAGVVSLETDGYAAVVDVAQNALLLRSSAGAELGRFNLTALDNGGCLPGAWNILQLKVTPGSVAVWFNTMLPESGFAGDATDRFRVPTAPAPRIYVPAKGPYAPSDVVLRSDVAGTLVDYVSKLPVSAI